MIKLVVWDIGGVIFPAQPGDLKGQGRASRHWIKQAVVELYEKNREAMERGEYGKVELWEDLMQAGWSVRLATKVFLSLTKVDGAVVGLMRLLAGKVIQVALVNEAPAWTEVRRLMTAGWSEPLRKIYVSAEIGWEKPAAEAYGLVLRAWKMKPAEVMVIDDRHENVTAAQMLGMEGIWYRGAKDLAEKLSE